jgi:excisionase family DNA binding protein
MPEPAQPKYLHTAQVAELLQVSPKTVARWAKEGRLPYVRTLGGHRRYLEADIQDLRASLVVEPPTRASRSAS